MAYYKMVIMMVGPTLTDNKYTMYTHAHLVLRDITVFIWYVHEPQSNTSFMGGGLLGSYTRSL